MVIKGLEFGCENCMVQTHEMAKVMISWLIISKLLLSCHVMNKIQQSQVEIKDAMYNISHSIVQMKKVISNIFMNSKKTCLFDCDKLYLKTDGMVLGNGTFILWI